MSRAIPRPDTVTIYMYNQLPNRVGCTKRERSARRGKLHVLRLDRVPYEGLLCKLGDLSYREGLKANFFHGMNLKDVRSRRKELRHQGSPTPAASWVFVRELHVEKNNETTCT